MPIQYIRVFEYEEISPYCDGPYNPPQFNEQFTINDFEREYDAAYDVLIECLTDVGDVDEESDNGDFSMYRHVPLQQRSICVIATSQKGASMSTIEAMRRAFSADCRGICILS